MNSSALKNKKTVYGAGLNDADYPVHKYADGRCVWVCPIYIIWRNMLKRACCPKYKAKKETYAGCTVSSEWLYFMSFRAWVVTQAWAGLELDKDILIPGNKHYSESTCLFVPRKLNVFLADSASIRGQFPIGVHFMKAKGKFQSYCNNPFSSKRDYLGLFDTAAEAHLAWANKKMQYAIALASSQGGRVAGAIISRYADTLDRAKQAIT